MESLWDELLAQVRTEKKILTDVELDVLELTYFSKVGIFQCNNCGAYAADPEQIKHHKTCEKGEAKKWEKFYDDANEVENQFNNIMHNQLCTIN